MLIPNDFHKLKALSANHNYFTMKLLKIYIFLFFIENMS